jgi:hypothetical protein
MATTMMAAAMATTATVEAATITSPPFLSLLSPAQTLGRERNCSRSTQRGGKPGEHHKVGVKLRLAKAPGAEHKAEAMFECAKLAFDGGAATVEAAPLIGAARYRRTGIDAALAERDHGRDVALPALGVDAIVVVSAIHRARLGVESANAYRVEQGCGEQGLVGAGRFNSPRERQAGAGANGGVDLVAVEAAAFAGGHGRAGTTARVGRRGITAVWPRPGYIGGRHERPGRARGVTR